MEAPHTTYLLWTSGWDSTYRLLDLLIVKKKTVKPYYLLDCDRVSLGFELKALRHLKNLILERFPECNARLLPITFKEISEIRPNPVITENFNRLRSLGHLGDQYEWLARFAEETRLPHLELCITRDGNPRMFLERFVVPESDGADIFYRLQSDSADPALQLFRCFRFPLFDMTKLQMQQLSFKHGFADIMESTWFCHKPLFNGVTCGTCAPCRYAREEGLSRRISLMGQLRYYLLYRTIAAVVDPKQLKRMISK